MSEKLPVLRSALAQLKQGSTAANVVRAGVAALALQALGCSEEETVCHISGTTSGQDGKVDAYECTCYEGGDDEDSSSWYSASSHENENGYKADEACIGVVNGINMPENNGGTGGSAGAPSSNPGVSGSGGSGGSSQPSCTPTTEVCDGYDNDCDGQIDENACATPPASYGWEICWPTTKPSNIVDAATYVSFAREQLHNTSLYCENINYLADNYAGQSATWVVRNRDQNCDGQIAISADGLKIGAATTNTGAETFNTNSNFVIGYTNGDQGCSTAFSTDNNVVISIQ